MTAINYIRSYTEPLSADIFIVEGAKNVYMYDTGNGEESLNDVKNVLCAYGNKTVNVILSHFHPDHIGNIDKINKEKIYVGANTIKYMNEDNKKISEVITDKIIITDGELKLEIIYLPSSHAKGSLAMNINNEVCLLGDGTYSTMKAGITVYNRSLLKEEIEVLKNIDTKYFILSHQKNCYKDKESVITELKKIYERGNKNDAYIPIEK